MLSAAAGLLIGFALGVFATRVVLAWRGEEDSGPLSERMVSVVLRVSGDGQRILCDRVNDPAGTR